MHPVAEELRLLMTSGYPLVYILTHEEERASRFVAEAVNDLGLKAGVWSGATGEKSEEGVRNPVRLLRTLKEAEPGATVLLDFHAYLEDAAVLRMIRDILPVLGRVRHSLVVVSPVLSIPPELEKEITLLELPLPTREDLNAQFRQLCVDEKVVFSEDFVDGVVRAALGLTEHEARRVFTKALRKGGGFKLDDISLILEEKKKSIRKSEVLEYFELDERLDNVGGLEEVKRWVKNRSSAFDEEARRYGLPAPKGLLLIGVQGCGKSLTAKAVAGTWRLPLIRLDLGAVFGSASPETSIHKAILVSESLAPVVLWVDEIEKGFAESAAGGTNSTRVFGSFVTWLQEKRDAVFVVATANEVAALPPELLRKGRFDETFFVDLPDIHERRAILDIHIARRKRKPEDFDLERLARQSEHFSGAELEQGVVAGMYRAFGEQREVTTEDISKELDEIVPLYSTYEEKIKGLRDWAKTRARRASLDQSLVDLFDHE